ncbi:MAG: glycosyltransferase [Pedobacter sp.]|nr:MAG: glycosyltransferase [Pedobacter sp.]
MVLAPIVIFCYNRADHLQKVVESLLVNDEASDSDLIIYSDGAKEGSDDSPIIQVRNYIRTISGFASIKIVEQQRNIGLAKSIVGGVTEVVNQYGKIIVLEDDTVISPFFLRFMNEALDRFEDNDDVACICAYLYPIKKELPEIFFIYGADCAVWATWKNQWQIYEPDGQKILDKIVADKSAWRFDFDGSYPYVAMLEDQIAGRNNSWAIRWYGSAFINNKLTLYPGKSLSYNIGWDNSGTNCEAVDTYNVELCMEPISIPKDIHPQHNQEAYLAFKQFFLSLNNWSYFKLSRKRFKRWIKYCFTNK